MDRAHVEPDGLDLLVAVRRRIWAFLIPLVLVTGGCTAYGFLRDPVYTAETRLSVGRLDIATQGIAGFASAEVAIASALARAVDAPGVIRPAAKSAGVSVADAANGLTASPVAGAPLIRVEAQLRDGDKAVALVNAAARRLVTYTKELGTTGGDVEQLAVQYAKLAREVSRLYIARHRLRRLFANDGSTIHRLKLQGAEGKLGKAILQRNSVGYVYGLQASGLTAAHLLGVLAPAYRSDSDRVKTIEQFAVTGLIAGIVLGLGFVGWREAGARRRRREDTGSTVA